MSNTWSENKYINLIIYILVFCVAINIFHYGQLVLPIICFILFVNRKCVFKVNSIKAFTIICLFSVSFCAFSYKLGHYSVVGFCLPMAYYIGSNVLEPTSDKIKTIIYTIVLGMIAHLFLNFLYDYSYFGIDLITHSSHFDFWLKDLISTTSTATNSVFINGCIYYVLRNEKKTKIRMVLLGSFVFSTIYCLFLGRRTTFVILIATLITTYFYDVYKTDSKKIKFRTIATTVSIMFSLILLFVILYRTNMFNFSYYANRLSIIRKIVQTGLDLSRLKIVEWSLPLFPTHLFGGQEISSITKYQIHDFWLDIYDYAGIVPYLLIVVYTVIVLKNRKKILSSNNINDSYKVLFFGYFVASFIQLHLEPVMTGASIYIITMTLIDTIIEGLI